MNFNEVIEFVLKETFCLLTKNKDKSFIDVSDNKRSDEMLIVIINVSNE